MHVSIYLQELLIPGEVNGTFFDVVSSRICVQQMLSWFEILRVCSFHFDFDPLHVCRLIHSFRLMSPNDNIQLYSARR